MVKHVSETPATRYLRQQAAVFTEHPYAYEEHGGTGVSARALGVDEHHVVKTLIMQDEGWQPMIVLMHGDCKVSTKNLARQIGCKSVAGIPGTWSGAPRRSPPASPCQCMPNAASWNWKRSISTAAGAGTWSALPPIC
jgi:hypothetical protein